MSLDVIAALGVRIGLVMLFLPFSALDKILGFKQAVGQAQQVFKPYALAATMLLCGLAVEILCSLGVVTGVADRACALLLWAYCVATAVLYKRFWTPGDFWVDANGKARGLFWDFLKNLSLGAGFLLIVVGTDGSGAQRFLHAPFSSGHPYQSHPPVANPGYSVMPPSTNKVVPTT